MRIRRVRYCHVTTRMSKWKQLSHINESYPGGNTRYDLASRLIFALFNKLTIETLVRSLLFNTILLTHVDSEEDRVDCAMCWHPPSLGIDPTLYS